MMISRIQKTIICSVLSCGFLTFSAGAAPASPPFRFHIVAEPSTLSPVDSDNTEADYLFVNLYRGLFSYDNDIGVRPEGAKSCVRKTPIRIVCALNPSIKWNDGVPVKAEDYVRAFVALFRPGRPARDITLLSAVKNADAILKQKKMPSELGIHATGIYELTFDLIRPDGEFEEKLTAATLVPWREEPSRQNWKNNHYNGPYQIKDWVTDKKITLSPNPHYPNANSARPDVEVFVVADDTSALNLYESGELDLLRRLPSSLIPAYRSHEDFFQTPLDRFDYLGFGPELEDQRELRQALSLGADYDGFAIAFHALGRPGCVGLSLRLLDREHCIDFNLKKAKEAFGRVPIERQKKPLTLFFSQAGGDDLRRVGEWYQGQWKKNLGIEVRLESRESKTYLALLSEHPPEIFRKGFSLDRPSCEAAVEAFISGAPNNLIRQHSDKYDRGFEKLQAARTTADKKRHCGDLMEKLISNYRMIPQGRIHFSMLQNHRFEGWKINSLNQLDLTQLHLKK